MLDRPIPTRKALVHSILISEVKDMKSDVLQAGKASLSEKEPMNLVCGLTIENSKKMKFQPKTKFEKRCF
jgi:hypothetical protein